MTGLSHSLPATLVTERLVLATPAEAHVAATGHDLLEFAR